MLSKKYRLTKRGSFTYVYNKGERKFDSLMGLVFVRGKVKKIGFSVPNKIGKAIVRNKLKRRMRAIVREKLSNILPAQVVFTLKEGSSRLEYNDLKNIVHKLLTKSKLIS